MDKQLIILILLTFVINLISTLAYAVRIAGVRVRRIAISLSLFNVLVLGSRIANSFQAPLLAKRIEDRIMGVVSVDILRDLRWLLAAAAVATIAGGVLTPTVQRIFQKAVARFGFHHSTFRLLWEACSPKGVRSMLSCACWPSANNITQMRRKRPVALSMITMNAVATAIWTVGVFAALYAAYLNPQLRVTASSLSSVINGVATIMLFAFVDPQLSLLTDDVVQGRYSEAAYRQSVVWLVASRFAGTVLAQCLLVPAAIVIMTLARYV